jgi:ABC-type sugar transport system substrate-binding protein
VVKDANFDPVGQAQQIQQAIDTHSIAGAWVFPVAPETVAQSIAALQAAGIPAVIEGPPAAFGFDGPQKGLAFAAPDFVKYGTKIGELAGTCASSNSGHEALFLTPPDTTGGTSDVVDAIKSAFAAAAPDVPIVDTAQAGAIADAQSSVSQLLIAHPDADVIIATTDETALGAIGAYKAAGKTPLCVVAGGGAPDTLAAQKAGDVTAVVAWDYGTAVEKLGANLLELIAAPTTEGEIFQTALKVTN